MTGGLETLDKANVQRLVDNISQKNQKLDIAEDQLEQTLIGFTNFFAEETPMFDENNVQIDIPVQFRKENHQKFKEFTLPIHRSLWAFTKVVSHMRQELYAHETPMPNLTGSIPQMGQDESKGVLNSLKEFGKKVYRDPNSPYNATKDLMDYYSQIPQQWINMVHHFELNIRNRPRVNTRLQLDKTMDDIVIVFNSHIEPNLVHILHYANIILKAETETNIVNLLTTYNQIAERHEKMMMMSPPQQQ